MEDVWRGFHMRRSLGGHPWSMEASLHIEDDHRRLWSKKRLEDVFILRGREIHV